MLPGGTEADGEKIWVVTSVAADEAGVGGFHGEKPGVKKSVAGQKENSAGELSGVRNIEGGHEASGMVENPRGDRQGVRGGVKLPQGINTPGVEELPPGYEASRVTTKGEGEPGEDGRGRGRYNPPPPPPEQPRRAEPAAATRGGCAGWGWRRRQVHSGIRRQTEAAQGPCTGILTALTMPGPSV